MAFKIPLRCGEYTITTGTGTVTTAGSPQQMQTFNTGVGTGNTCPYTLLSGNGTDWERGIGTVTVSAGVTTVARTTVVESTNGNAAISLVGTSYIYVCQPGDVANTNGLLDEVFGSSNGTYNLVRSGGIWTVAAAGAGAAGSGLFSPVLSALPTASSTGLTTWQTQNSATVSDGATGIVITGASASNSNWNMRTKAAPATPYTITALLAEIYAAAGVTAGIIGMAIGFTDGTKLHVVQYQNGNLLVSRYTNSTTFSANDFSSGQTYAQLPMAPMWFRIKDDGVNITFYTSTDGANFQVLFTTTRAAGFLGSAGYTNVLFGANSNGAICMATLMSFTQA